MPEEIKLKNFEGPLDLLLRLIADEEMDITEVSLSAITEQFFSYLDELEKGRDDKLSDFLVVAAKLVYLKSRKILPYLYPEEEKDKQDLTDQLKLYKKFVDASKKIEELWNSPAVSYGRVESPVKSEEFAMPLNATAADLKKAMDFLLRRLKPPRPLPQVDLESAITVKQVIDRIYSFVKKGKKLSFEKILADAKNRTEVIVSFLAVLELARDRKIKVSQSSLFGNITLN